MSTVPEYIWVKYCILGVTDWDTYQAALKLL